MPKNKRFRFHPEAEREMYAADDGYADRNPDASDAFIAELVDAVEAVVRAPQRWPRYLHGTRRCLLHRFPFSVVYLDEDGAVVIIAIAHAKRRPGYWKRRV